MGHYEVLAFVGLQLAEHSLLVTFELPAVCEMLVVLTKLQKVYHLCPLQLEFVFFESYSQTMTHQTSKRRFMLLFEYDLRFQFIPEFT